LSGLQKQVLSLYRQILRAVKQKPEETRAQMRDVAREEFRKHQGLPRSDVVRIEYLVRRGKKQLDRALDANVSSVSVAATQKGPSPSRD